MEAINKSDFAWLSLQGDLEKTYILILNYFLGRDRPLAGHHYLFSTEGIELAELIYFR